MYNLELLTELFILTLAVSRLSKASVDEVWLFHVGIYIRHLAGVRYIKYTQENGSYVFYEVDELIQLYKDGDLDNPIRYPLNSISELFNCYWCCSVWVALAFLLLRYINFDIYFVATLVFAVSAASIYLKDKIYG